MDKKFTLGIIGAGNMASAVLGGILKAGMVSPGRIAVSDPDPEKLAIMRQNKVMAVSDNRLLAAESEYLMFAVKPQVAPAVVEEIKDCIDAGTVISIMAGVRIETLAAALGSRNYARIMPNTPALVGEGVSAVAFSEGYSSRFVLDIFKSIGDVIEIDEKHFAAVTSLSGSGPAYVYMFIDALIKGGVKGGLPEDVAKRLAVGTVRGSAKMVGVDPRKTCELVDAVCSKGGTTIRAVESFREDGLEDTVIRGMDKCRARAKELGDA